MLTSLLSHSVMYAFARDGGISPWFDSVNTRLEVPVKTLWLATTLSFCLALPSLGSSVAFAAATSIATIGLYISYTIPIMLGLIYHKQFEKGPWNLGRWSRPVAFVATVWVIFICIVFCLPTLNPVNKEVSQYPHSVHLALLKLTFALPPDAQLHPCRGRHRHRWRAPLLGPLRTQDLQGTPRDHRDGESGGAEEAGDRGRQDQGGEARGIEGQGPQGTEHGAGVRTDGREKEVRSVWDRESIVVLDL